MALAGYREDTSQHKGDGRLHDRERGSATDPEQRCLVFCNLERQREDDRGRPNGCKAGQSGCEDDQNC